MAQKVTVEFVDDLDGSVITDGAGGTITFALEGKSYEIDLSGPNTEKLYEALNPFIESARPAAGSTNRRRSSSNSRTGSDSRDRLQEIREWAKSNGHQVASRGRISRDIQDAYERANG